MASNGIPRIALVAMLLSASPALASDFSGFEIGARTGYAFSAGSLGAPPNETDNDVGDYVSGQWPLWLDVGYRIDRAWYLGGYFQYGFGFVNDDRQDLCRNADVDCSASDIRLGIMGRYHLAPLWQLSPWLGLGIGYEWGAFSLHQSIIGSSDTDSSWSGYEIVNLQAGADFHVSPRVVLAPFISFSLGQFQKTETTTRTGSTTTTTEEDLDKKSMHEWIFIGLRVAFAP